MTYDQTKDGQILGVPEPTSRRWMRTQPPHTYPSVNRHGARGLLTLRFDTEKEVHHVCFVTYQAKRTWATSFQVPAVSPDGHGRAHSPWSACVEGTLSVRVQRLGLGQYHPVSGCAKAMGRLLTWEEADGTLCLQCPGSPHGRG